MPSKRVELQLARLTREFFSRHPEIKLVAVTGSAGKTSAKIAIATVLAKRYALQLREEAPQTKSDVFLQIMGVKLPAAGPFKWLRAIWAVKKRVKAERPEIDIVIQEFNPQELGYNAWFRDYIVPDITVVTSVTNGRMQVNHPLEEVANEMLSLANYSRRALINRDDIEGRFAGFLTNPNVSTYGTSGLAEYHFDESNFSLETGHEGVVVGPEYPDGLSVTVDVVGEHNVRPIVAAVAVAAAFGVSPEETAEGVASIYPLPGRMRLLEGADDTIMIDDSYSATPLTMLSALQTLYALNAPQKIAILGNINGLKDQASAHMSELGRACNASELDWVVTVGEKANRFLAPAAKQNGCQVMPCTDAIIAGAFVREKLHRGGIALFKGSSGGVWLEEAIKINLRSTEDEKKLVRQTPEWLERKNSFFSRFRDS